MKAMILAAGLGKRLGAITSQCPKALVPVGTRPMLEVLIEKLKSSGVSDLIMNLHYRGDMIRKFVADKGNFGINIDFSEEPILLNHGGGILKVRKFFSSERSFLIHNCDVYSECDLRAIVDAHNKSSAIATIAVVKREQDSYLVFDSAGKLLGWESADGAKSEPKSIDSAAQRLCFTGIYVLSPKIFDYMRDEGEIFSIINIFTKAAQSGELLKAYSIDNSYWIDIGTPESLAELTKKLKVAK